MSTAHVCAMEVNTNAKRVELDLHLRSFIFTSGSVGLNPKPNLFHGHNVFRLADGLLFQNPCAINVGTTNAEREEVPTFNGLCEVIVS
ncbi:MAG: hypothetical protein GF353_26965 [Candidatus Lokiarchaeota archaeon]|nr:hypothetical protein [Candidatus Lokiarchaeota archaeon]